MTVRRAVVAILIVFVVYAVLNSPDQSAGFVGDIWDRIRNGGSNVGEFFNALLKS